MKLPLANSLFKNLPRAYLVGGSVRDMVRGDKPLDYDIIVPECPEKFAELMADRLNGKVFTLGKGSFSVYRIVSNRSSIDVTAMKGNDIQFDLEARDFTINALACDLTNGKIFDCVGGLADLRRQKIRMVAPNVFQADPVRLIRAFRMAATLGFEIEPRTFQTIALQAGAIVQTAGERIRAELEQILACPDSYRTLEDMSTSGLLFAVLPELAALQSCGRSTHHATDVFTHTMHAYRALEDVFLQPERILPPGAERYFSCLPKKERVLIKLSILLHDVGKPATLSRDDNGRIHFYGHPGKGAAMAKMICKRLRMSNRHCNAVERIIRYHQRPLSLYLARQGQPLRPRPIGRFFRQCDWQTPAVLIHAIADNMGKETPPGHSSAGMIAFFKDLLSAYLKKQDGKPRKPLINGQDLMTLFGLEPSPLIGKLLRSVEELQLADSLQDREQALRWVSDYLDRADGRHPPPR